MQVRSPKPRRSLLWQGLLGLCLIGCIAFIAWALHDYSEQWQLAQVIAEIDATDPHWHWEDIQARRPAILNDQNMGYSINDIVIGLRLHNYNLKMNRLPVLPWKDSYLELFSKHKIENYELFLENHPNAKLPQKWKEPVAKVMGMNPAPESLDKMRQLTNYRTGRFEHIKKKTDYIMVDVQGTHTLSEFLGYDVLLRLEAGDLTTACQDVEAMLACARVFDQDDFPVAISIRYSTVYSARKLMERTLAQSKAVPAETLLKMQEAFAKEESAMPSLSTSLRVYRAFEDQLLTDLQTGKITFTELMDEKRGSSFPARKDKLTDWAPVDFVIKTIKPELFLEAWARPRSWAMERIRMLRFFNELLAWSHLEEHRLLPELQRLKTEGVRASPFMAAILHQSESLYQQDGGYQYLEWMAKSYLNHRATCRATAAALAAERYRLEHGTWPTSWEQLIPKYLATVPIDPFTSKPLFLKLLPDGLVIYSVGSNGIDDGGSIARTAVNEPTLDIGFRLWNPAQRGIDMNGDIKKLEAEW